MKIVFCSSISSLLIVGRLNKRLPVASDSLGVTDSYDAAGSDQMKTGPKKLTLSKIDFLSSVIIIGLD